MANKYKAIKTIVNGKTCDSKLEARHYAKLLLAEKQGAIKDLQFHPRYTLHANGIKIGVCELDFSYIIGNMPYFIDSKGVYTAFSKWKHKHFTAEYGHPVEIWRK
jgi:hypothetical protein